MPSPVIALGAFAALVVLTAAIFWPRSGLVARLARMRTVSTRVHVEDTLKYMYDCETRGMPVTLDGLAGVLQTGRGAALDVLQRAQQLQLVTIDAPAYVLTDSGRAYALRIIRAHRLLETFLADRTGMSPGQWHTEAERQEHLISEAEADELARRMGQPLYDPHGDPIPTSTGEVPAIRGFPFNIAKPGAYVRIVHLEDEPTEVFERLLNASLALGQVLKVLAVSSDRIEYTLDGERKSLAMALAGNVSVEETSEPGADDPSVTTLSELDVGETGAVVGISSGCHGSERRRLLDLGVVPGTDITAIMRSAAGSPIAYDIRGALIGLRREQADWIRVRRSTARGAAA